MDKQCEYLGCAADENTECWCTHTVPIGWNEYGTIYISKNDPILSELHEINKLTDALNVDTRDEQNIEKKEFLEFIEREFCNDKGIA